MRSRQQRDVRRQRLAIVVGVAIILAILAFPAYGYYNNFIRPPRVWASRVNDVTYTMGDLVKRIRTQQAALRLLGSFVDLSRVPFEVLFSMTQNQLIIQEGSKLGITVTEEEIDAAIRNRFFPSVVTEEEVSPGQLESEFRERYIQFLDSTRLDEREFRQIMKEGLFRAKLQQKLAEQVPSEEDSVEAYWLVLPIENPNVEDIQKQVDLEGFRQVIRSMDLSEQYSDGDGYVGWLPKGAFPGLDAYLFGNEEQNIQPLEHNVVSEPLFTQDAVYIVQVVNGPEKREVNDAMRVRLEEEAVDSWVNDHWNKAADEGLLAINFNSDLYSWVADQVKASRARFTPPPG